MGNTMGHPGGRRQGLAKARFGHETAPDRPWLIILNALGLKNDGVPSFIGAACDPFPRFWPACSSSPRRRHRPTAGFSSLKTRPTAMASISASPRARNVVRMPRCRIADRGISRRPRPIAASIRTKSQGRFPNPPAAATIPVAANMSRLPVSAEPPPRYPANVACGGYRPATPAPRKRRDAAPRSGYVSRVGRVSGFSPVSTPREIDLMAGYA